MHLLFNRRNNVASVHRKAGQSKHVLLRALASVVLLVVGGQAAAAPLACDSTFYQIRRNGSTTHFSIVDRNVNPYVLTDVYTVSPLLNGLGFNPVDNYIYAIASNNPRQLYRFGSTALELTAVTISGIGTTSTLDAGTFDEAGNYFIAFNDGIIQRITGVTGAAPSPVATTVARQPDASPPSGFSGSTGGHLLVGDWAFNPAESTPTSTVIYGTRSNERGSLYLYRVRIDDPSGTPTAHVSRRVISGMSIATNAVGTVFMDSNGMLYAYHNAADSNHGFYRIDPTTGAATTVSGAASATQSDGANCPLATALVEPTIVLNKTTVDGVGGPFAFTLTNTGQASGSATTVTAGAAVQVDGDTGNTGIQPFTVSAFNQPVTIAESSLPEGWSLTGAACTVASGAGGGGTAVGSFNAATRTYTIPGSAVVSNAQFACTFTNTRQAVLRLQKAFAAGGRVQDTDQVTLSIGPDGGIPVSATTTGTATAVTSPTLVLTPAMVGAAYTLSEAASGMPNLDEYATSYSCTNAGGTTVVTPGTGASFAVTPVAGDDLTCTFTNSPLVADLQIVKTTTSTNVNVGDTVVYTLAVTNNGPGDAQGALIQDPAVTGLNCGAPAAAPTCGSEAGGAVCPVAPIAIGDLQGAGVVIPTLPVGGSVVLALSCVVE